MCLGRLAEGRWERREGKKKKKGMGNLISAGTRGYPRFAGSEREGEGEEETYKGSMTREA